MKRTLQSIRESFRSSIKLRIITIIGGVFSLLMILTSIGILMQWRTLILEQQTENAKAITRAFSIPVIESLIYSERENVFSGDLLESHIQNFMQNVEDIRYISIQNNNNRIIAHSDLNRYDQQNADPKFEAVSHTRKIISSVFKNEEYGWIVEAVNPLQIGDKRWGTVQIGFDASFTRDKISSSFILILVFTVLAMIITLIILYYIIDRVMASLRNLITEIDKIDLESNQPMTIESRSDEIGFLIDHFEMLKKRLAQSKNQLANAQHQIYQAEKLASIGRLASGVAHEVNNPLNGIRFCLYGIQKDPDNQQQTEQYLNLIDEGINHIESVVTKLLGYSRQRTKSSKEVDLEKELHKVLELLDYRISEKNIEVHIQTDDDMPVINADPNLMQEMLMNLLLNSLDAISEKGQIVIKAGRNDREHIYLTIRDNGTGIIDKDIEKIFEPFYTTKDTGKGTGLGLSVTQGIVESHNGTIKVNSKYGSYTEFNIILPLEAGDESIDHRR